MLVGREVECGHIEGLLEAARAGRSGALILRGEPGIGKSTLCAYAVARAEGVTVLKAQGIESEAELPFAALADLLRPLLGHARRTFRRPRPRRSRPRSRSALRRRAIRSRRARRR